MYRDTLKQSVLTLSQIQGESKEQSAIKSNAQYRRFIAQRRKEGYTFIGGSTSGDWFIKAAKPFVY